MKAIWNGATIAESDDTVVVEGNHYFPEASLKREYVTFSNHRSSCPWKGQAHYYSLMVDGEMNPNAVWYYPEPVHEAARIKGLVCFYNEFADRILVDGVEQPKPETASSHGYY